MSINEICQPENDGTFWWLIMGPNHIGRNVVVELNEVLENWWFTSPGERRNYNALAIQRLLDEGAELVRIQEPSCCKYCHTTHSEWQEMLDADPEHRAMICKLCDHATLTKFLSSAP